MLSINTNGKSQLKKLLEESTMALVNCPSCSAQTSNMASVCSQCGKPITGESVAPIHRLSGKLSLLGALIVTIAVIGTVLGTWWGPAAFLPGIAFFMMSRFL